MQPPSAVRAIVFLGVVGLVSIAGAEGGGGSVEEGRGPVFLHEPPSRLHFSNTTGALLPCSAHGNPPPRVEWLTGGEVVTEVADVRVVHTNGSLQFLPFPPYAYTAVVHAATYSCRASSSAGTILSRPVHVRAVVRQYYEVQVYDEFVISGNTAVIKCHVPSFVRDYVSVTSWVRGNGERIVSDVLTGGRYSVFGTGELHIRHVTKADEFQSYHCETQHVLTGETTVSAVAGRLMVNEPRSSVPPRITDSRSTVTASVRDTVELPCAAQGYPIPQYQWHRISGKVEVAVVQDGRIQQVGGSLLIRQVTAADAGRYVCVVSSSVDSERAHTTLEVWAPLTAHISPQVQTVDVGGVATFNCSPEGFPQDTITWLKDGEPLEVSDRVRVVRERSVVIEDVQRDDRGMYQCLVSNLEGTAQGSAQLKLGDAAPQWLDTSGPQVVSPGATVTLVCVVQGSPPPALSWTLRGLPALTSDPRISVSQSVDGEKVTGRLNISSVRVEDGGQWSCLAENRAGKVDHTGRLNVRGPPSIRPMRPVSVVAGRTARFNCIVAGFPIESIYWEKNGVVLPVSDRQEVHPNGTLEVHEVSREADSGQYTCVAVAGENTARANLQVNVMVPPLIDERIFSLGSGFPAKSKARIMCVVERGDLPLTFTWTHDGRPLTPGPTISVRALDEFTSVLLFDSLRKEDGGKYTCTATNAVASSSRTVKLVVKVAPTWKLEPDDSSVVVGSDLVIPCAAHGSPSPTITWRRAEGAVPRQYRPVTTLGDNVDVAMNSSLVIMSIKRDQGGEFLCSASNGVGSDLSKSVRVTVKVPPQFDEHEENVTVTAGQRARLTCESHGDLPITAIWSTGNPPTRISSSDSSKGRLTIKETILSDDSSLSSPSSSSASAGSLNEEEEEGFRSVLTVNTKSRHDSKVFFCLASNIYGNDTKKVNLIVQEVPGTPGTPRVVDSGSRSVNITWSPPSHDGNSVISIYRILIINSTDSWMNVGRIKTMEVSRPVARVTGLKPAHTYLVRVVGVNSVGASPPSPEVKMATAHEPPTKPASNVRVIPISSTSLRVTWQPPDGVRTERAGLGYYIGYKVTNSSEPFRYQTLEPSAASLYRLEATLKSLHKFTSYMVTVQAFNSAGAGPRTTPVSATTEEDVPSEAPRDVQCTSLSSTSLLVQWTSPPLLSIHGILQGYKVIYRPVHPTRFFHPDDIKEKTIVALRTQLNGLDRYTNYSVTVAAYTRRGSGIRSDPVYCITEEDVPGPVESVKALAVDSQSVLVAWRPPKAPNGIITKYTVHLDHPDQQVAPSSSWGGGGGASWGLPGSRSSAGSSWDVAGVSSETGGRSWVVSGSERQYLVANLSPTSTFGFTVRASTLVGEGPPGTRVTQRPRPDAPAAIASFSDKTIAVWGEELRLACRVVGNPSPVRTWTINGKVVPSGSNRIKEYPDGSLLITDVKAIDAGNYTCTATNIHGSDAITYSVSVQASRDQGVPPSPPRVYVSDVTSTTITVRWSTANAGGAPILGYYLHEKREFGEWRRMEVPADADSYTLTGLQCGTRYQVYVSAYNHVGVSQASDTIPTKTLGREPVVPAQSSLLRVNVTSIALNLAAWLDGGCPITSMVIEYRERGMPSWTLVSNHVRWDNTSEFLVLDLKPAMRYTLKVTAHNSAGSSIATYPFTTLTHLGATLSPIIHDAVGVPPWYLDSHVLVAVVIACILVLLAVCVAVAYTCRRTRTQTQTYKEVNHVHNDLTPDSGLTSDTMLGGHSLEILEAYTPSTLPLGSYDEISPYATFRMPGENNKTPPPPPLPSRADTNSRLMPSLLQPVASVVESGYSRVKRKGPQLPDGGLPPTSRTAQPDHTYDKSNKAAKGKNVSRCPSVTEKATSKEASGSSVTSVSSNHEELVRAYHAHANDTPTTPESGRRNKCGVATSSEVTTESDTTAEPDLVSFCAAIGNSRALRVPALFKPADGDYSTVADMVGGRSRTESTTSHEESSDEAKGSRSHRRPPRGQEPNARQQGHRPSRGDPDYSYARPVKKQGPPPPPLSSTESNSAEYADGWPSAGSEEAYSRRHTLEFSEAECDHPSAKKGVEPLDQLMVDLEMEKIVFDTGKNPKVYTTAL